MPAVLFIISASQFSCPDQKVELPKPDRFQTKPLDARFHMHENKFMNVKTADRILDVFETFANEIRPLSLSELAQLLSIPASSCFGLIRTLENRGYIYTVQRRSGYYPTKRLLAIAEKIIAHDPLLDRIAPSMEKLRDETGETVLLGKLQAGKLVYLHVTESHQSIRYTAKAGELRLIHANSMAKAILGTMTLVERQKYLEGFEWPRLTDRTLLTEHAFEEDLERAKKRGWYGNLGESVVDLIGLSWPVQINQECYAISVSGPHHRMAPLADEHGRKIRQTCKTIEAQGQSI
jgi:IclR family acetate operon transcriptional repressor